MEWKHLFSDTILRRGRDYWINGRVHDLEVEDDTISAFVDGTQEYEVKIAVDDDEVEGMYCSCPYAADENTCKHMAAVLFKLEDEKDVIQQKQETLQTNLADLIESAEPEKVKSFLLKALRKDRILEEQFRRFVNPTLDVNLRTEKDRIDMLIYVHTETNDDVQYIEDFDDFEEAVEVYIEKTIYSLIDHEKYDTALELSIYLFEKILSVENYDEDGYKYSVEEDCGKVWATLAERSEDVKRKLFNWIIENINKLNIDSTVLEDILLKSFLDSEYESRVIAWSENRIQDAINNNKWRASNYIRDHIKLLDDFDVSNNVIETFCRKYWDQTEARQAYMELCFDEERYDELISVLKESIVLDRESQYYTRQYHMMLKDAYKKLGRFDDYLNQLWVLSTHIVPCNIDVFRELKSQYSSAEWEVAREELFNIVKGMPGYDALLMEEALYDLLLEWVMDEKTPLRDMRKYENVLVKIFPDQILYKYKQYLDRVVEDGRTRKAYQELVLIMSHMKNIEGGKELVRAIVNQWKLEYPTRKVMIEELSKLRV